MTLIKSISGIRGTIGGKIGESLTPVDVVKFAMAFGQWTLKHSLIAKVVIGRDARASGEMISSLVTGTLRGMGIHVIDLGLSTTPTVELAVANEKAGGGIVITASHNPKQWNALKLLNRDGEFLSEKDGKEILRLAEKADADFSPVQNLGKYDYKNEYIKWHIEKILKLPLVKADAIRKKKWRIAVDAVNSTGGIAVPMLLKELGAEVIEVNCEPNGNFSHNPEPLPENLTDLSQTVKLNKADLGISVDPDVDRLCFVCEDGSFFGEEYTLVAVADYILKNLPAGKKGNSVSNLSSTRALQDVTEKAGGNYFASSVGEVNVVEKMKEVHAMIGGEGNGGVIYPELHYGRDALVGIALFLSHLALSGKRCSVLRTFYPNYFISKNKIELSSKTDVYKILKSIQNKYKKQPISSIDGVRIEFEKDWVHLRKSNTEPIIRIYAESNSETQADNLAKKIMQDIREVMK
jgi:phosphomannomutase